MSAPDDVLFTPVRALGTMLREGRVTAVEKIPRPVLPTYCARNTSVWPSNPSRRNASDSGSTVSTVVPLIGSPCAMILVMAPPVARTA